MSIATTIRSARRARKLTQERLGARAKIDQSQLSLIENGKQNPSYDTVDRILKATGQRLIVVPTVRDDAFDVSIRIASALESDRVDRAFRELIQLGDNLAAEHGVGRVALAIAEPAPTGEKRWDAAIAALVAHRLAEESLPEPPWVADPSRSLLRSWVVPSGPYTIAPDLAAVPDEFRRRRVLLDRDALLSA